MRTPIAALVAIAIAFCAFAVEAAPLDAYARIPLVEAATLSPDGKRLAILIADGEQRSVAVRDVATKAVTARASSTELGINSIRWVGNTHVLIMTYETADPIGISGGALSWRRAHILNAATSKLVPVLADVPSATSMVVNTPMIRTIGGRPTLFVEGMQFVEHKGAAGLFQTDLETGRSRLVKPAELGSRRWFVDADGRVVAQEQVRSKPDRWILKVNGPSGWRDAHTATSNRERARIVALGRGGRSLLFAVPGADQDGVIWQELMLDGSSEPPPQIVSAERSALTDPQRGALLGYYELDGDRDRYSYFDPGFTDGVQAVTAAFRAITVEIKSWSEDRQKVVAWVEMPGASPGYFLVDLGTRKAELVAETYPGLTPADVGITSRVRFKAADGLDLVGYLTRPAGKAQEKKLPLIVVPHDGPSSRDLPNFNWWAQAMASRGYAVLQVNYRGSRGYGRQFLEAGRDEWGRKMQTDLSDGIRALAKGDIVDAKRVCIVGRGYGGYAALAGIALEQGVYRCAVSVGGVSDLRRQEAYRRSSKGASAWLPFMSAQDRTEATLAKFSPASHAAKVDGPVLLVHAQDDAVVPIEQSRVMAKALRDAGKPVEVVEYGGTDHWLGRGETRMWAISATMAFVEKHNPPN